MTHQARPPPLRLFALWEGDFVALSRLLAVASARGFGQAETPATAQLVIVVRLPQARADVVMAVARLAAPQISAAGARLGINLGGPERGCSVRTMMRSLAPLNVAWWQLPERAAGWRRADVGSARVLRSCHDAAGVASALASGADACTLSPIWPTASKVGHSGLGLAALTDASARFPGRVVALGGVDVRRARAALAAGAAGIAARSAPWGAAAGALLNALLDVASTRAMADGQGAAKGSAAARLGCLDEET